MTNSKFTKSELRRLNWRWIWNSQIGWNYERMQGLGYLTTMLPVMEKLYADDPEAKAEALKMHSVFFNTQPAMGDIIVGINIAIEEQSGKEAFESVVAVKTGLMGPFAGVGDTIFGMIAGTVLGSIAVDFGMDGSYLGILIWSVWNFCVLFLLRPWMFNLGYKQGLALVTTMSDRLQAFTEAASVLGVMVIGAMVANMVHLVLGYFTMPTGNVINFNNIANSLMPRFTSAVLAGVCYWSLGKKSITPTKLIILLVVVCVGVAFLIHLTGIQILEFPLRPMV